MHFGADLATASDREHLLPGDELGGGRLREQVHDVRLLVHFRGRAQRAAVLGLVGGNPARCPRPHVESPY